MTRGRTLLARCAGLAALATVVPMAGGALGSPPLKLIECQKPLVTGEEAYDLRAVSAATACPVVLALGRWEYAPGHLVQHITELYRCVGPGKHTPTLKLRSFDGWRLSLTKAGDFQMSRAGSSFEVTGTDFPLNCS